MNPYQVIFQSQKNYFTTTVKQVPVKQRVAKLKTIKKWIKNNQDFICQEVYKDFKKSREEVLLTEIKPVIDEINHAIKHITDWTAPKSVATGLAFIGTNSEIIYEPKGVCLIIAPWNYPFNLCVGPLVSAIAAGCVAIIKPSENTPHTSDLIVKMMEDLFSPSEVAVCIGDYKVSQELLALPFDHIFFTGSPQVGKIIMKAAAEHLTSVTLELGGRNPLIVDETANCKDAAQKIIWGKFLNAGQTCISINYLYVHAIKQEELERELVKELNKIYKDQTNDYTAIVNTNHFKRLNNLLEVSIKEGAKVLAGGDSNEETNKISPTILTNITTDFSLFKEEIFGPILPIITYTKLEDVLQTLNAVEKPLSLYVFSKSKKNIQRIIQSTSAGTTAINDTTIQFAQPNLPFGGVNHSGIGKAHGKHGFLEFTNQRSVLHQRVGITASKLIYPPYTSKLKKKFIDIATWWL